MAISVLVLGIAGLWLASIFPGVQYRVDVHAVSTTITVGENSEFIGQQAPETPLLIESLKEADTPISVELVLRTNMTVGRWFSEEDRTDIRRFEYVVERQADAYVLYQVKDHGRKELKRDSDIREIAVRLARECEREYEWAHMRQW